MQRNTFRLCAFFLFLSAALNAQELYMPRNIRIAYEKGTRSFDGKPGKNYWQNHGNYDISVEVEPRNKIVSGRETIVYRNNSRDTLKSVAIRFVNNIHKPEAPRAGEVSTDFLTSGLKISSFKVDGIAIAVTSEGWGTVADVKLGNAILPGKSSSFEIVWTYPLSKQSGREGQIDSTTFFAAYA